MARKYPTMKAREYLELIDKLGLTQEQAGDFLGFTGRSSRRWIAGVAIPPLVAIMLRYMVREKLTPQDIRPEWDQ